MATQKSAVDSSSDPDGEDSPSTADREDDVEELDTPPSAGDTGEGTAGTADPSEDRSLTDLILNRIPFPSGWRTGEHRSEEVSEPVEPTASEDELHEAILDGEESTRPTARPRPLPQDDFLIYDRLTRESSLAQDTLGFDYVRGDGIIVSGADYIGLVEVQPRNWLVLNDAERTAVFRAFMSFLLGLKYPVQIASTPREFDISKHTEKIRVADSMAKRNEESPILRHGRRRQVAWVHNTIDTMSVKDRDFYVVTRVSASHLTDSHRSTSLGRTTFIGGTLDVLTHSLNTVRAGRRAAVGYRSEERCVKEVRARQHELSETLTKTGVSTRIVSDRNESMDILYQHYNHVESPFTTYNHATYTKLLSNALNDRPES